MHYHIPAFETPAAGSRRILTNLLDNTGDRLATPAAASDTNIHEMRKTCKKLRALLRLLRSALPDEGYRTMDRKVRDFGRQFGTLRDNKVILDTLDQIGERFSPLLRADTLTPVRAALGSMTAPGTGGPAVPLDIPALQAQLADLTAMVRGLDYRHIGAETLLAGLVDCYRRGRRALARMEASTDTENAHALRRLSKYQYYQLQMLAAWNDVQLKPLVDSFHELEDTLGHDHDLAMLEDTLAARPEICQDRVHREMLNALIESRRIALMSHALRLARELFHTKPGKYRDWLEAAFAPSART